VPQQYDGREAGQQVGREQHAGQRHVVNAGMLADGNDDHNRWGREQDRGRDPRLCVASRAHPGRPQPQAPHLRSADSKPETVHASAPIDIGKASARGLPHKENLSHRGRTRTIVRVATNPGLVVLGQPSLIPSRHRYLSSGKLRCPAETDPSPDAARPLAAPPTPARSHQQEGPAPLLRTHEC
jgi:hypothetical protein